ncbi:kinase-like protein, partial [Auricularia subglabra TFB-10046 SS5]
FGSGMYVAKRFVNVGKEGPVSLDDNREAVEDEVKNVVVGRWLRNKFCDTANHKGVNICSGESNYSITHVVTPPGDPTDDTADDAADKPLAFGTVWLVEPLRPSQVTKFSGTMVFPKPKTPLECTLHAFVHYVFQISGSSLVYADLQGTPGIVKDRDGTLLFDPMVHTPKGCNSVGDHGNEGIETWKKQHICESMCLGLELPSVQPATAQNEAEGED